MKTRLLTILLLCVLVLGAALGESGFYVSLSSNIKPYRDCTITVTAPETGTLQLALADDASEYQIYNGNVLAGQTVEFNFDGLQESGEAIPSGSYRLEASISAESRGLVSSTQNVKVLEPAAALQYVIPSADRVYGGEDGFHFDYLLTADGTLEVDLAREEAPDTVLFHWSIPIDNQLTHVFRWSGLIRRRQAEEGTYIFTFSVKESSQEPFSFRVNLVNEASPVLSAKVSEGISTFLPENTSDTESIWSLFMQPVTVVSGDDQHLQKIYKEPSSSSEVLGRVYCASQGLCVLETGVDGYAKVAAWCHENGKLIEGYVPEKKLTTFLPNDHYGLLVCKQSQKMYVYKDGTLLGSMDISTGLPDEENPDRETECGAFLTTDRIAIFENGGYYYRYALRIAGKDLIHSVGSTTKSGKRNEAEQLSMLGTKASHGCIRVDTELNEYGLNCYWLWTHIPYHTKVFVIDEFFADSVE